MATGNITTGSLADSLPTVISSAMVTREYEGVMPNLVDKKTLGEGIGLTWNEITLDALTAVAVTETTELDNPQQLADTLLSITPTVIGVETFITDRVAARISAIVYAQIGGQMQNAIQRKKDEDGLAMLDAATTSLCGAGATLTTGHLTAAKAQIAHYKGNAPYYGVLHSYQEKDVADEITAGVGAYAIPEGLTARVFESGVIGQVGGVTLFRDDNISIDTADDAKGGVFAMEGIILVQGRSPRTVAVRRENIGGGGTSIYQYDEYAYGERTAGYWLFEIYSDATAPTS